LRRVDVKPLSVNQCWQGKRFKTPAYKAYEKECLLQLRPLYIPPASRLVVRLRVWFSNAASDIDNPVKPILDILQKKYGFNDKLIYQLILNKQIVKKGDEFIEFGFEAI